MHRSFSMPEHGAHIRPFVLGQTFFKEVVQFMHVAPDRNNDASHCQSLHVRDAFVKRACLGIGHAKHCTRLLGNSMASHPAA
jgi:hypothetical protein